MIRTILLLIGSAISAPAPQEQDMLDQSNMISYQSLSPGLNVAFMPTLSRENGTCVFALSLETRLKPVDVTSIKIAFDDDDLAHAVPVDKKHFPQTNAQNTWYVMSLKRNIAIIKTVSYGKSGRVIMSRSESGECDFSQI